MRIGIACNVVGQQPAPPGAAPDWDEEFDKPETVETVAEALRALGHKVEVLGDGPPLLRRLLDDPPDFVFNFAEGTGVSRSREARVPAILEMLHIPYSGSDPLTLAAKRAVEAGLVVVSAAGNLGRGADGHEQYGGIGAPGNAPWVITVGASSHNGTADRSDDNVAAFSSRGPSSIDFQAKPDLVAPGVGIESLAEAGSTLFTTKPLMRLWGTVATATEPYLSLSGTSMAAPVVSGTIALMLQADRLISARDELAAQNVIERRLDTIRYNYYLNNRLDDLRCGDPAERARLLEEQNRKLEAALRELVGAAEPPK